MIEVDDQGVASSDPFPDSVLGTRDPRKLPASAHKAAACGLSPFVARQVLRLGGRMPTICHDDPRTAFCAITWKTGVAFDSRGDPNDSEELFFSGLTFLSEPGHLPAGFARNPATMFVGCDSSHFFGLRLDPRDPLDPLLVALDHETEGDEPMVWSFLSFCLERLAAPGR